MKRLVPLILLVIAACQADATAFTVTPGITDTAALTDDFYNKYLTP